MTLTCFYAKLKLMNRRKIKVEVSAKINLSLNITGTQNNMHLLDSVMASVSLTDAVTVCERFDSQINIQFDAPYCIPINNTVKKATDILCAQFGQLGADIFVKKNLPLAGGLGGSSADAAAVIVAIDKLYGLSERGLDTLSAALKTGSDVPFMLSGGFARVMGTGMNVERFSSALEFFLVLCSGDKGVNTADCYGKFDELCKNKKWEKANNDGIIAGLKLGDRDAVFKNMGNALTEPSMCLESSIAKSIELLSEQNAEKVFMTGSGSCCVGVFCSEIAANIAAENLRIKGLWSVCAKTLPYGIKIID